jgi:outer membrane protein TolC
VRLPCLLIVLFLLPLTLLTAQQTLTLNEAVRLGLENNIEVKRESAALIESGIELDLSSTLPNPVLNYSREDLSSGSNEYGEWSVSGSLPLNFLWERWSNVNSKKIIVEVQQLMLDHTRWRVSSDIKHVYTLLQSYSVLYNRLGAALEKITALSEASKERVLQGDISEYESQRILLELSSFKAVLKNVELKKINYETNLKMLTGISTTENILIDSSGYSYDISTSKQDLIVTALKNRSDLKALRLSLESGGSYLNYNKLKVIPEISILAGYKYQTDNLKGSVFSLNLQVPLFNRNQSGIDRSELELNLSRSQLIHLENRITSDVSDLYDQYTVNKTMYDEYRVHNLENLLETAYYSYEQGESSLIDFLDGMNAFIDGLNLSYEIRSEFILSFYKLQEAAETLLNNEEF